MEDTTARLVRFCKELGLTGAFTATRSGNFISGVLPEGQHRDTFVAMTAIIHGGAETTSMELKSHLDHILVNFSQLQMLVMGLGTKAILGIIGQGIGPDIIEKTRALANDIKDLIQ
jgi:predicted regulator of Ras-like GTPase activity (Roadblock/LC7/MglB family)